MKMQIFNFCIARTDKLPNNNIAAWQNEKQNKTTYNRCKYLQ